MGTLSRFVVVALLVVLVVAGAVYLGLNRIVRAGLERGGSFALGVETQVDSVDFRPLGGRVAVSGVDVANPTGFASSHFLRQQRVEVHVDLASVRGDRLVLPLVSLRGLELALERKGGRSNYGVILEHIAALSGGGQKAKPEAVEGQTLLIRVLEIQDVAARAEMEVAGRVRSIDLKVPDIRLENVGSSSSAGGIGAQLAGLLTTAILNGVLQQGQGLPGELVRELRGDLGNVAGYALGSLERLRTGDRDVVGGLRQLPAEAGETVEKAGEALKERLGGLLRPDDR